MFSRANDPKSQEVKRPASGKSAVPSILSAGARMVGNLRTEGDVHVDGYHEGEIHAKSVHVSPGGVVAGAITAEAVQIEGQVEGAIAARSVSLGKSSRVAGDVLHETLSIEPGARLQGQCLPREEAKTDGETALCSKLGYMPADSSVDEHEDSETESGETVTDPGCVSLEPNVRAVATS